MTRADLYRQALAEDARIRKNLKAFEESNSTLRQRIEEAKKKLRDLFYNYGESTDPRADIIIAILEGNQCDGCRAGIPVNKAGHHTMGGPEEYSNLQSCERKKYVNEEGKS
jgi:predicted  nucleic acid-binding Zn-ribbon protein